jgi:tellurite resistance protein TerC
METPWGWWVGFNVFVLAMLALDLGVFHRKEHAVGFKEAVTWTVVWVACALVFNLGLLLGWFGDYEASVRSKVALEFLTGYLIEKSLSVDNVFVFAVIFGYFAVPPANQHKVLFYGIIGALVCRAAFIFGGIFLIETFAWTQYLFGALLVLTGIKMALTHDKELKPERNPVVKLARRLFPISEKYVGAKFFARIDGRRVATPMLLVLLIVETTDIVFAVDSIPAIIAITQDRFIVYTSNVFAILGLRALYFALAGFLDRFHLLSYGLALLLVLIGVKMLANAIFHYEAGIGLSLGAVGVIIGASVVASLVFPNKRPTSQ